MAPPRPIPFWVRRAALLVRGVAADRERPDLLDLGDIEDPERFVWEILPHAARTFAACIALMPKQSAMPSAVAYLYCRMLDTYEDLVGDPTVRDASLRAFADRLTTTGALRAGAPVIDAARDRDGRDRAHLLLVRKAVLVDRIFLTFDETTREIIRDLVVDMSEGMRWSSATFAAQGGVLTSEAQLTAYCGHVLGNPTVFGIRILRHQYGHPVKLTRQERDDAMRVGEFVQLANITRDIEKDLVHGVAYDQSLRGDLRCNATGDAGLTERCRVVREQLLRRAVRLAPAYGRVIASIGLPALSVARAASVLMMLFTERYYHHCAVRAGVAKAGPPTQPTALIARSLLAAISPSSGRRQLSRAEQKLLALGG